MLNIFSLVGVGFLAAGVVLIVTRLTRWNRPKYVLPLAIGGAMIAFPIYNEYSWYGRYAAELPERVEVVKTYNHRSMWQVWTRVIPRVDRFLAIDRASVRRNPDLPEHVMVDTLLVKREEPTLLVVNLVDCGAARRAELAPDTAFDDSGLPVGAVWIELEPGDPLLTAVCGAQ